MDIANSIFGREITEAIGWFIVHSLWQGVLIALLLLCTLLVLKRASSRLRYYLSFVALLMLVSFSAITFQKALVYAREKVELKQSIISNPDYLADFIKENGLNNADESTSKANASFNLKRAVRRTEIQKHFPWIVSIWFFGLLFYFLKILIGLINHYRLIRFGRETISNKWIASLRDFTAQLKIKKEIGIFLSSKIALPLTTGFLKPVILIPASLLSGLSQEQLEAIIAHELAHIKRNDYIINILQTLIETIFFFHPAVWYISSQIRKERENACDDIAIELTNDKLNYAKALAMAQEFVLNHGSFAMAFSPFRHTLLQRIKRLNTKISMKTKLNEKLMAGLIILGGFVFLSFIIDGNTNQFKHNLNRSEASIDSTLKSNKIVIKKTTIDDSGNKVSTERVYKPDMTELDSLVTALEEHGKMSKELEKVVELAILDDDDLFSEEIFNSLHVALEDLDIQMIVSDAMEAAKMGMMAAEDALKDEKIHLRICESIDKEFSDSLNEHTQLIVKEALAEACKELEDLDINIVIADALEEANKALQDLDIDVIITEALEEAQEEMDTERRHIVKIRKELDEDNLDLEVQEQKLIEKEEVLKQELEELEKEIKDLKKKQKEEAKDN